MDRFPHIDFFLQCGLQGVFVIFIGFHLPMAEAAFTLQSWHSGATAVEGVPIGEGGGPAASGMGAEYAKMSQTFEATLLYSIPESQGLVESAARSSAMSEEHVEMDDPFSISGEVKRRAFSKAAANAPSRTSQTRETPGTVITSCLLATPESASDSKKDWTVQWRAESSDGNPIGEGALMESTESPCVWAKPVRIGAIPGIQVFVSPARLEALLPDGTAHVRIMVQGSAETVAMTRQPQISKPLVSVFLNGAEAVDMAATGGATASFRKVSGPLATPPGKYRLSYPSVGADGIALDGEIIKVKLDDIGATVTDVESLRSLYHGQSIPVGSIINGDEVWFYAPRTHTTTDRSNSVFATPNSSNPSSIMTTIPAFTTLSPQGTEVAIYRHRRYDVNLRYERASILPVGQRYVFWQLRSNDPSNSTGQYALTVNDLLTTTTVNMSVTVLGLNKNPDANPDHFADFSLEGAVAPRISWEDNTSLQADFTFDLPTLPNSSSLQFQHFVPNDTPLSGGVDYQNLDIVDLAWTGKPRVDANGLCRLEISEASDGQPRRVSIGGFTVGTTASNIVLLNVTDAYNPIRLTDPPSFSDETDGIAFEFEAPATKSVFLVQRLDSLATPAFVGTAETMPTLTDNLHIEGIVVRPPEYTAVIAPLVALRGPGVVELEPQAAYNAYNHGQESPDAIREAIAAIIGAAASQAPLPWILLAGNGSVDWRNHLADTEFLPIPPFVEKNQFVYSEGVTVEMATDYPFSLLAGEDDLPDAQVGRIPARTVGELTMAVNRILAQDARLFMLSSQPRAGLFVTDNVTDFLADAPKWISQWAPTGKPTVSLDLTDPTAAKTAIKQCFENPEGGAAFALYVGHGNMLRWDSNVVDVGSIPDIDTEERWPIVASLTCLNGDYAYPKGGYCLAEAWLFAHPDRGAVANIAPTAVDDYYVGRLFLDELMGLFALDPGIRPEQIGEVLALSQIGIAVKYPAYRSLIRQQHLFGDPSTGLTLDIPVSGITSWWVY